MMHETEAYAASDEVLADWLAEMRDTRTNEKGEREMLDPNAGLWFSDQDAVDQARSRRARRLVLGSAEDTHALNRAGL